VQAILPLYRAGRRDKMQGIALFHLLQVKDFNFLFAKRCVLNSAVVADKNDYDCKPSAGDAGNNLLSGVHPEQIHASIIAPGLAAG
jgi:hypothetical protein